MPSAVLTRPWVLSCSRKMGGRVGLSVAGPGLPELQEPTRDRDRNASLSPPLLLARTTAWFGPTWTVSRFSLAAEDPLLSSVGRLLPPPAPAPWGWSRTDSFLGDQQGDALSPPEQVSEAPVLLQQKSGRCTHNSPRQNPAGFFPFPGGDQHPHCPSSPKWLARPLCPACGSPAPHPHPRASPPASAAQPSVTEAPPQRVSRQLDKGGLVLTCIASGACRPLVGVIEPLLIIVSPKANLYQAE